MPDVIYTNGGTPYFLHTAHHVHAPEHARDCHLPVPEHIPAVLSVFSVHHIPHQTCCTNDSHLPEHIPAVPQCFLHITLHTIVRTLTHLNIFQQFLSTFCTPHSTPNTLQQGLSLTWTYSSSSSCLHTKNTHTTVVTLTHLNIFQQLLLYLLHVTLHTKHAAVATAQLHQRQAAAALVHQQLDDAQGQCGHLLRWPQPHHGRHLLRVHLLTEIRELDFSQGHPVEDHLANVGISCAGRSLTMAGTSFVSNCSQKSGSWIFLKDTLWKTTWP